jgi:hypothetical protein
LATALLLIGETAVLFAKIVGTGEAGRAHLMRLGLRFQISLDWKRMRDEEHSLKTA